MDCTVQELHAKQQGGDEFLLLDVRTHEELGIAKIEGCTHVPLHEIEARVSELVVWKDKEVICMCHHGGRSAMAQSFLAGEGFTNARNLLGGINAWACEIDQEMDQY